MSFFFFGKFKIFQIFNFFIFQNCAFFAGLGPFWPRIRTPREKLRRMEGPGPQKHDSRGAPFFLPSTESPPEQIFGQKRAEPMQESARNQKQRSET